MSGADFLLPALVACLVLTGIHTYLGLHVVTRGIIFIDIALAQLAALGMSCALLLGHEPDGAIGYAAGLSFTFLGGLFFANFRSRRVPLEAVIGIFFAVAQAIVILIADLLPHGSEHLKYLLSGNILWVSWGQIAKTAALYAVLGAGHYFFRERICLVSTNPEEAARRGLKVRFWDLFFYITFGLVITSSVQIAGVLLVFTFLIVPAACSLLFFTGWRMRLLFGWGLGMAASTAGIVLSGTQDFPTGPAIIAVFGVLFLLCLVIQRPRT